MSNLVFNIAKGRVAELFKRVDDGDPANARLLVVAIVTTETDGNLQDLDTLALVLGNANTAEATNSNYARKTLAAADVAYAPDDAVGLGAQVATGILIGRGANFVHDLIARVADKKSTTAATVTASGGQW